MPKLVCLLAAALMLVSGAATAHSWYPKECCHDNDCRPVPCAELSYRDKDVVWRKHIYFNGPMIRESKDGDCHVCVQPGRPQRQHHSLSAALRFRPARDELSAMIADKSTADVLPEKQSSPGGACPGLCARIRGSN